MFNLFTRKRVSLALPFEVDIHSHLLPGLDDGVKSIKETIYILSEFQKLGYKKVITTPHVMSDHYPNSTHDILSKLENVNHALKKHELNVTLEAAAEYYLDESLIEKISSGEKLLTFGDDYLLFETSFFNKPVFLEEAIFQMNAQGYQPILAHPERYGYLQNDFKLIDKLKNMNLLFQMNLLSLTNFYSSEVNKFGKKLLKAHLIDFVGSDCHNAMQANEIRKTLNSKIFKILNSQRLLNQSLLNL